jgi:ATP-dependent DNA helicase RecG
VNQEELCDLIDELRGHDRETEWIEFKHNNEDPTLIGELVSALAKKHAKYLPFWA